MDQLQELKTYNKLQKFDTPTILRDPLKTAERKLRWLIISPF